MILIADDNPNTRRIVAFALRRGELECVEAVDGEDALAAIEREIPDLLLLDVMMPRVDGLEVCRRLRAGPRTADLPIIMISALAEEGAILRGFDAGADDYLVKPLQPSIVLAKVRATLAARRRRRSDPSILSLPPGTRFDERYTIQEKIDHGGMGVIYRASHDDPGEEIVIKILDCHDENAEQSSERFLQEIEALSEIDHPNVIRFLSAGLFRNHHYYTMEFARGSSLRERIDTSGSIPPRRSLEIAREVAIGLGAVHSAGFIHRDIKPKNIFLLPNERVKIADFGIALPLSTQVAGAMVRS